MSTQANADRVFDICTSAEFLMLRRKRDRAAMVPAFKPRWWAYFLLLILSFALYAGIPNAPDHAHAYADAIALPRMQAAVNEFVYLHPKDRDGRQQWEHVRLVDVGDRTRGRMAIEAAEEWIKAQKKAGY